MREIRQRRPDSLGNGAMIGTIVGAAIGTPGAVGCASEGDCDAGVAIFGFSIFTLAGTGGGTAIDAMVVKQQTIYRRQTASSRLRLLPLLSRQHRGITLQCHSEYSEAARFWP